MKNSFTLGGFTAILAFSAGQVNGQADKEGNCLTQRIDFSDPNRFFFMNDLPIPIKDIKEVDVSRYDMTVDYTVPGQKAINGGKGYLHIAKKPAGGNPQGTRLSTTRFLKYGKVSASLKSIAVPGVVNTFITAGPFIADESNRSVPASNLATETGDEIDWEILGKDPRQATNNVFYRGIKEYSKHDAIVPVPKGVDQTLVYGIEWKKDQIVFTIDDKVVRTYNRNGTEANSQFLPNTRFFPDRPQKVQLAVWSEASNAWAGGPVQWPSGTSQLSATIDFIDIICYDDNMKPVPKWPLNAPDRKATEAGQPTSVSGSTFPSEAGPIQGGKSQPPLYPPGYNGAKLTGGSTNTDTPGKQIDNDKTTPNSTTTTPLKEEKKPSSALANGISLVSSSLFIWSLF